MGGSGLLFVDFDLHMKMQINIVVPTQNKTKNGAEKLGRKERYLPGVVLHQELACSLLVGLLADINLDLGTSAEVPSLEVSLSSS